MLNQTDVKDNHNKFYIIQLIEAGGKFSLWTHWGRVGEPGQFKLESGTSKDSAFKLFSAKFRQKTGVGWPDRVSHNWAVLNTAASIT
jgi:poly [ADP-ribose] polymerase